MRDKDALRKEYMQNVHQSFNRLYERNKKRMANLSVEEIMRILEAAGGASEQALLETTIQTGGAHPGFDSSFTQLARVATLSAVFDLLIRDRGMPGDEFVDHLTRIDQVKVAWVYEMLPRLMQGP